MIFGKSWPSDHGKHTKLRDLLVLKQKKAKRGERRRANSNGVGKEGGRTCLNRRGEIFENLREI